MRSEVMYGSFEVRCGGEGRGRGEGSWVWLSAFGRWKSRCSGS